MSMLKAIVCLPILCLGFLPSGIQTSDLAAKEWWETTLVYQIWPRGFQDSNGDGEGDLQGIINRLNYIKDLGVETIWLNPIYPSPLVDAGYDVSNYMEVHPLFGNLQDFDKLIEEAHNRGLKVITDMVLSHSSNQHDWFQQSAKNVDPYRDYYIWSNGTVDKDGAKHPPNNWTSVYSSEGGSAWTWHADKNQWYYHKFHESQPNFNLRNEKVRKEFQTILAFWLAKGVDGFRINAFPYFSEDENSKNDDPAQNATYTFTASENNALLYDLRTHIDKWVNENKKDTKLLIIEPYGADENLVTYYGNYTHKGIAPFNFRFITRMNSTSAADHIKNILQEWFNLVPQNENTNWVLSNHDSSRAATRIGLNRVDGLHMLSLLLPGQAYTYYGEEIAMLNVKLSWNQTIDPMGCSRKEDTYETFSRDPARTPMQWNSDTSAGFSNNTRTYLPLDPGYEHRNVEFQSNQSNSNIQIYKKLASLRKNKVFTHGDYQLQTLNDNAVLILKRFLKGNPVYIVLINIGLQWQNVNLTLLYPTLKKTLNVIITSSNAVNITNTVLRDTITLSPNAALVVKGENRGDHDTATTPGDSITTTEKTTEDSKPIVTSSTMSDQSTTAGVPITNSTINDILTTMPVSSTTILTSTSTKSTSTSTSMPTKKSTMLPPTTATPDAKENFAGNVSPILIIIISASVTVIAGFGCF